MSSIYPTVSTLENLPDELLLLICRYLSSSDVLFSFYGLNFRLSTTISGFCRHVVLAKTPFNRFNYICKSILPNIGTNISSLVLSNDWNGVLSKTFLSYFGDKMSLTFPRLKHLTLIVFYMDSLIAFLDCLQNLTELFEITIRQLNTRSNSSNELQTLLHRSLAANNGRLNSVIVDYDSDPFSVNIQNKDVSFFNIEKLHINLKTINDLHELLTVLPRLSYLDTQIHEDLFVLDEQSHYVTISTLKYFYLRSHYHSWNLDELISIIKRIPNIEELSITIQSSDDIRLMDGEQFSSLFSALCLRKFNYFLQYQDFSCSIDHTKILSTWKQFKQEFVCIKSDDRTILALYTLPFISSCLILPCSLAKNEVFIESYASQVEELILYDVSTDITDIFPAIKKCRRIKVLELAINKKLVPKISKEIQICKLSYLTRVVALFELSIDAAHFQRLLEASPNLRHLEVNYEFLRPLLDDESVCILLKQRITHIYICIYLPTTLESVISSMSQLTTIFPSLKHLYFGLEKGYQPAESLILAVLNCLSKWNSLISFCAVDVVMTEETLSKDLQHWVIENSILNEHSSFFVGYIGERFRLWI